MTGESRILELDDNVNCCALVNLGDKLKLVPDVFYPQLRKGRVVVATSLNKEHWSNFSHEQQGCVLCLLGNGDLYILQGAKVSGRNHLFVT